MKYQTVEEWERAEAIKAMRGFAIGVIVSTLLWGMLFLAFCGKVKADWDEFSNEAIVTAIGKTENSKKFPYGIKSIKCIGEIECRKICLNSVRNGRARWEKAGKPDDLIVSIGRRYSPPDINPNWVRLVKYFLNKGEK